MPSESLTGAEFASLIGPLHPSATMAVAVSGGADSMALALLAHAWAAAKGITLTALTVDHRLRPESAAEAAQVQAWLAARGIPHHILAWNDGASRTGNLSQAARNARYALMSGWCRANGVGDLLVAHHRDDQAETVLLRLKRGSHIHGLSGMRPVTVLSGIRLLRPLLDCPKARLAETLKALGQSWLEDPSNADQRYDRNRLRAMLAALPCHDTVISRLAHSAARLRALREALEEECDRFAAQHATMLSSGGVSIPAAAFAALNSEAGLHLLSGLLQQTGGHSHPPRFNELHRLYTALCAQPPIHRTLHRCRIVRQGETVNIMPEIHVKSLKAATAAPI
ncbi:MAG: tRNA lysidine(34) synthetase TilS [Alphaproteobacteria bacterium]|nr:tRNA lysidine(34) synthetase TilS [Alphaproteobacteria bacterium]